MKVVVSRQALEDLRRAGRHTRREFGERVALALEERFGQSLRELVMRRKVLLVSTCGLE
jgi:plasmid stabilization system protein ParE